MACLISVDGSAPIPILLPLYVNVHSSLAAFRILSSCLYFASFTIICCAEDQLKLHLKGVLCARLVSMPVSFPRLWKFSAMICSRSSSHPFLLSSGNPWLHHLLILFSPLAPQFSLYLFSPPFPHIFIF